MLKNKTYDVLKFIALTVLPALVFFISSIWEIWGLPYGSQIVATIAAFATFLGALLGVSSKKYRAQQAALEDLSHDTADD